MKPTLLLFSCLMLAIFSFAQVDSVDNPDHIKIILKKDSIHISFQDRSFNINTIQDLDSWLKENITERTQPDVDLVSYIELTPQQHRDIIVIMDKYRCPVVSEKAILTGKPKVTGSIRQGPSSRR